MLSNLHRVCPWLGLAAFLLIANTEFGTSPADAQTQSPTPTQPPALQSPSPGRALTTYPTCQPPATAEFLLLVVTPTPTSQSQVGQLLPPNTTIATCTYLEDTVTRVGGFRTVERANAWARYIKESTGLSAYVARPVEATATATPPAQPPASGTPPTPQSSPPPKQAPPSSPPPQDTLAYAPKPLSTGYAVLVDYASKPQVANQLQQALSTAEIGLVSYNQRPYLLASHTPDSAAANRILRTLSDRGFSATVVDSRRVVLLKRSVSLPKGG
jgi:hypothetical protein